MRWKNTPEQLRIANLLTTYHNFYEDYEDSIFDEAENPFYAREMENIKRTLENLDVFFYYISLFGQRMNDCWYVAVQKIVWYHLEKINLLAEWVDKPCLPDGRPNPLQVWQSDYGLRFEERYVLEKFGLRPIPRQMLCLSQEVFPVTRIKKISCAELRENLEKYGPLWVALCNFGTAKDHASVIVGVGKDCVILNDSSRSKKDPKAEGRIIILPIDDFNKCLSNFDSVPIWYYPMRWQGRGFSFA